MGTGISDLVAARLSQASYTALFNYRYGTGPELPPGWPADVDYSRAVGSSQFIVFVNEDAKQITFTFKAPRFVIARSVN
jgi:hypothetical protein